MDKLRVWWIPRIPMVSFKVDVSSIEEGRKILDVLADYDKFQFEHNIKPDHSNTGGLQYFDEELTEWFEFEDEEGNDIWETYLVNGGQ